VNGYMFTIQDLENAQALGDDVPQEEAAFDDTWPEEPAPPAPPKPSAFTRAKRGTLGALKRFFNASGD